MNSMYVYESLGKRKFNKILNSVSPKDKKTKVRKLDVALVDELSFLDKLAMTMYLIRHRLPVVKQFIPTSLKGDIEWNSWLNAMGYMYNSTGKQSGYSFIHTSEHKII